LALRLEAGARAADVPIFVDPALVRTLARIAVGAEVPEDCYASIAEWMVMARRMRQEAGQSLRRSAFDGEAAAVTGGSSP
jgi:type III secretion system FlhB-like substrate exporter